jgi:hypothetical protein
VIQDVDATLKELLVQMAKIDTSLIDIKFEMPTREWSASVSKPTINAYLYDMRENHELRSNDVYLTRAADKKTGTQRRAPARMDLSYLITVWTSDIADEHQLLGQILLTLLRFPLLPDEVLKGSLLTQPLPIQAWIAQPERTPNPWDFWGHVEHRLKSGLSYVVTTAFEPTETETVVLMNERDFDIHLKSK